MKIPPGCIDLHQAVDRVCISVFRESLAALKQSSKRKCEQAFRILEYFLKNGLEATVIAPNVESPITEFDRHQVPFRIRWRLSDSPGLNLAKYRDILVDVLIAQRDFELALEKHKSGSDSLTPRRKREALTKAFENRVAEDVTRGEHHRRDHYRKLAKEQFSLPRAVADAVRREIYNKLGKSHFAKGGRPRKTDPARRF